MTELHKVGAPVTLLFGTALHEYRNGTGNCVQANFKEDDFDIGVFRHHFHYVVSLFDEIEKKFGWKGIYHGYETWQNTFLLFHPPGQEIKGGFQVDVYALKVDQPREGLIDFTWDGFRVAKNAMLPLVKHKPAVSSNEAAASYDTSLPYYYMPYNKHCFFTNLYGETYMTPQSGYKWKKNTNPNANPGDKFNNPPCAQELSDHDLVELQHQMSFSNKTYELQRKA